MSGYTLALIAVLEQGGILKPGELEQQINARRNKQVDQPVSCHESFDYGDMHFSGSPQ